MQARRIDQHQLRLGPIDHAQNPVAGGLRLGGDDGHLAPHQGIDQGGFADIGPADDGHMPGAKLRIAHAGCPHFWRQQIEQLCRGQLLGAAAAAALADGREPEDRDLATHGERLRVRIAADRRQRIHRQSQSARLQQLPAAASSGL